MSTHHDPGDAGHMRALDKETRFTCSVSWAPHAGIYMKIPGTLALWTRIYRPCEISRFICTTGTGLTFLPVHEVHVHYVSGDAGCASVFGKGTGHA